MHVSYRVEVKNTDGHIVRIDDFTRITEITSFHRSDIDLAHRICLELTKALTKVGTVCTTSK